MKTPLIRHSLQALLSALAIAFAIDLSAAPTSVAIVQEKTFEARSWSGSGNSLQYRLWVPPGYIASKSYPLVIFLHGAGQRANDNPNATDRGAQVFVQDTVQAYRECIVLAPRCPLNEQWVDQGFGSGSYDFGTIGTSNQMDAVIAIIGGLLTEFNIDNNRILATGLSMGGYGTFNLANARPDWIAAAMPIAGGGSPPTANAVAAIPHWIFHGDADPIVPVSGSREMASALLNNTGNVRYTEYPGAAHNTWDVTYSNPAAVGWLLDQEKSRTFPTNQVPTVNGGAGIKLVLPAFTTAIAAAVADPDGGPQPLNIFWDFRSGPGRPGFSPSDNASTTVTMQTIGDHVIRVAANDGSGPTVSREIAVSVTAGDKAPIDLMGRWRFDKGTGTIVEDSSPWGSDGTALRGDQWITATPEGSPHAMDFSTQKNAVKVPNTPVLNAADNTFTLSMWARPDNGNSWNGYLINKADSYSLQVVGGKLRFTVAGNGNGAWLTTAALPTDGAWLHVAVVFDGAQVTAYFNGQPAGSKAVTWTLSGSINDLVIGAQFFNTGTSKNFGGDLDDVMLANRALSKIEVEALAGTLSPQSWREFWWGTPLPPESGLAIDADGDGEINEVELIRGGNPRVPDVGGNAVGIEMRSAAEGGPRIMKTGSILIEPKAMCEALSETGTRRFASSSFFGTMER